MRKFRGVAAASMCALALAVAGCGSDDQTPSAASSPVSDGTQGAATPVGPAPTWTVTGTTGTATVTAGSGGSAPTVDVTEPFAVDQTQVHVLSEGTGEVVGESATVTVDYLGVNGRTGVAFDGSYERGTPATFPLTGVISGFAKAIAGQKVGSTVAVAMAPADGYPEGQPAAGINAGDTLIFVIDIKELAE